MIAAAVLSGNRNFEARIHQSIMANFLMSPPLVVAFAIAGRVTIDMDREPLGKDRQGRAHRPEVYRANCARLLRQSEQWNNIPTKLYAWDPASTYIREPPYFLGLLPR